MSELNCDCSLHMCLNDPKWTNCPWAQFCRIMTFFNTLLLIALSCLWRFLFSRMRFLLIKCLHCCVIACQLATKGILRNMSLLKTKLPGLLPNVECIPVHIACIVIPKASSMKSLACVPVDCCGSCP